MSRRCTLFRAVSVGVVGLAAILAAPGIYWRTYGWLHGEPSYRGRPLTYWRNAVAECISYDVFHAGEASNGVVLFPARARTGVVDSAQRWFAGTVGWAWLLPPNSEPVMPLGDATAVAMLTAMLGDPDPRVRYHAIAALMRIGPAARPAIPALEACLGDRSSVPGDATYTNMGSLGSATLAALGTIDPVGSEQGIYLPHFLGTDGTNPPNDGSAGR